jgi:hypothetical protein
VFEDNQTVFIEVKDTTNAGNQVFLTKNEVELARSQKAQMAIFILHDIDLRTVEGSPVASEGIPSVRWPWDVSDGDLKPMVCPYIPNPRP